jgi:glycosyltransferase involved in cell wall biosynthesis
MSQTKLPISAFIICRDERENLVNCIESLDCCSEIVIVDSGSTDGTIELVQNYIEQAWPIRFMHQDWLGYAAQKQFALEQCTQPWCLSLDADERLDKELQESIGELLDVPEEVAGWRITRRPYLYGLGYVSKRVREGRILRLIRRGRGAFDLSKWVHEGIVPEGEIRISTKGSLLHFRALPMDEQILKENNYSTLKADMLLAKGQGPRYIRMFFNPPLYFIRLYFTYGLWRCKFPGFIHAMTGAIYSFLTEAKIYQRNAVKKHPVYDCMDGLYANPADCEVNSADVKKAA